MMWEYSHYLLFVQAVSLFLLDSFALAQTEKVLELFSFLTAGDLQAASEVPAIPTAQELQRAQAEWWVPCSLGPAEMHVISIRRIK